MPVFNERATIREILAKVKAVDVDKEIIVVDDGSRDGTREILQEMAPGDDSLKLILHERNQGKGAAIRTGLGHVTGDLVVVQDADLEYEPEEYKTLMRPILQGKAVVVYGSRFLGEHRAMYFWHAVGNNFLTLLTNILYDSTLTDMETCYKMFKAEVIKSLNLKAMRFEFEPEVTAKVLKRGIRIYEVPISYAGREYSEGKKITGFDAIDAITTLLKYRFTG